MSKTPEEKAREYAKITPDVRNVEKMPKECAKSKDKYNDYLSGYTEAISDNQSQLTAYREALKEMVDASINTCDMQSYIKGEEIPEDAWDKNVDYLREKADKAKQLLGENKQQTCYKSGKPCDCSGLCRESY